MGLVREPEGVDFIIKSRSLTKKEAALLSEFIRDQKAKRMKRLAARKAKRTASVKKKSVA
jgi:hypothetical protein